MSDTPEDILAIQRHIFHALSPAERFKRGLEQTEAIRQVVENSVRMQYPQASQAELKEQVFRRYYSHDLPPAELEAACQALRRYWERQGLR
jgi:hypothetical protein